MHPLPLAARGDFDLPSVPPGHPLAPPPPADWTVMAAIVALMGLATAAVVFGSL